jgi:CelD/BcsL family acetyltransferase involved in cellulose biosynthesis
LDLNTVRADSEGLTELTAAASGLGCEVSCTTEDVTFEVELPATWDEFLGKLSGKQRHEVRRKLRRMCEAAEVDFRLVEGLDDMNNEMETFLMLFGSNRSDKAAFMTGQMAAYFRSLAETTAKAGLLKLFFLDLDGKPAAAVMCFDHNSTIYLYNNGYDGRYGSLSVGVLSKVLSIKESILEGKDRYDFLKGAEKYKQHLGGVAVPLSRCRVKLT